MHRLTARVLLILLLVGTLAPVALAISAPSLHACCMRKPMRGAATPNAEFYAPRPCCGHHCCPTLTVSHWAHAAQRNGAHSLTAAPGVELVIVLNEPLSHVVGVLSTRAPPQFSIA